MLLFHHLVGTQAFHSLFITKIMLFAFCSLTYFCVIIGDRFVKAKLIVSEF